MTDPMERYEATIAAARALQPTVDALAALDADAAARHHADHVDGLHVTPRPEACDDCAASGDLYPVTFTEPVSHTDAAGCERGTFGARCVTCHGYQINPQHHDPGGISPAAWHTFGPEPTTCPACLDELGTELENEYRAAIERNQDRAQEARAGGRGDHHRAAAVRVGRTLRDRTGRKTYIEPSWPIMRAAAE